MTFEEELETAYACERAGDEAKAVVHYEAALALGVPEKRLTEFALGYGAVLRTVGRSDDAVAVLGERLEADPGYAPLRAFLALALLDAGHARAAVAVLLELALNLDDEDELDGYQEEIALQQSALLEAAIK